MANDNDELDYWTRALAGERLQVHDGHPQSGYYKARLAKDRPYVPVQIWRELGQLKCRIGYDDLFRDADARDVWIWCCNKPVSRAAFKAAALTHIWPAPEDLPVLEAAEHIIATTDDGGELEYLSGELERCRRHENAHHLESKRQTDAKFAALMGKIEAALKRLKEEDR